MDSPPGRRRSQRLFLQVRVVVHATLQDKSPVSEETHTIVVNAHGALLELSSLLEQDQTVTLQNVRTGGKIECTVKLVKPAGPGKFSTALEFKHPDPDFWRISFPPEDWAARNVETKKNG
jgi:hypothetical protein